MQAITTKFHGPTNYRGARVSAVSESGLRCVVAWDYAVGIEENHEQACAALCRKLGWSGTLHGGSLHGGGYVWVFADGDTIVIPKPAKEAA